MAVDKLIRTEWHFVTIGSQLIEQHNKLILTYVGCQSFQIGLLCIFR